MMESGEMAAYLGQVVYGHIEAAEVSSLAVAQSVRARLAGIVTAIQIIYVLPQGIRKIARYNREINNYYSDTEGKTYSDIRTLLVFFVATSLTSFVASIIGKEYFADSVWLILIPSLLFSTLLYALGYIGNRHNFTIEDLEKDELNTDRQESLSPENPALAQEYRQRREIIRREVLRLLEYEELFRNPTLRITDVAARLGSNRAYISRMINQDLNTSFSDLVNSYRIEYAKKLLQEPRRSPMFLSDVYERSGFSSESSFYRIFKKGTGLSPKAWHDRYSATGGM